MMTTPLTAPEIDLRDFPFMPLDVIRLRDSGIASMASGEEFRAAVLLWCAAWHQVPAASLPQDDRILAHLAGFGRDIAAWRQVAEMALHGFVLCDDGRLYHPVIAEKAIEAWTHKQARRQRTAAATKARRKAKEAKANGSQEDDSRHDPEHRERDDSRHDERDDGRYVHQGTGTGTGTDLPYPHIRSDTDAPSASQPALSDDDVLQPEHIVEPIHDPASDLEALWLEGVPAVVSLGVRERQARSVIGRWLKDAENNPRTVLDAIRRARDGPPPVEPIAWITAALNGHRKHINGTRREKPSAFAAADKYAQDLISAGVDIYARPDDGGMVDVPEYKASGGGSAWGGQGNRRRLS